MSVFVCRHLRKPQHGIVALQAVVVRLLPAVLAVDHLALLARRELFESRRLNRVELLVLSSVSHHFVRVGANEVAFEAMKVGGFVLSRTCESEV